MCGQISPAIVQKHLIQRRRVSAYTANQDLRYLRATFNYGMRKKVDSEKVSHKVSHGKARKTKGATVISANPFL
jgi:hypothetical protein